MSDLSSYDVKREVEDAIRRSKMTPEQRAAEDKEQWNAVKKALLSLPVLMVIIYFAAAGYFGWPLTLNGVVIAAFIGALPGIIFLGMAIIPMLLALLFVLGIFIFIGSGLLKLIFR